MATAENLRNKYHNHCVIKPLIEHCEKHNIDFEMMKESRRINFGMKCIKRLDKYYLIIGNDLIYSYESYYWDDLFKLITSAYKILGLSYHDNLVKAAKSFNRAI